MKEQNRSESNNKKERRGRRTVDVDVDVVVVLTMFEEALVTNDNGTETNPEIHAITNYQCLSTLVLSSFQFLETGRDGGHSREDNDLSLELCLCGSLPPSGCYWALLLHMGP